MNTIETLLLALTLIFAVPYLIWRLGNMDFYAPLVVVQILTGIALGPGVLGNMYPTYYQTLFTHEVVNSLSGIATWGVMLFVWLAGIELDIEQAWKHKKEGFITAGFALLTPLFFGALAASLLLSLDGTFIGHRASPWQFIVAIGMACAITALPILILFLEKLSLLRDTLGQRVLRFASLDDVAVWAVLALVLMDWLRLGRQLAFVGIFILTTMIVRRVFKALPENDRWYGGIVWLAMCGFAADWAGLHYMVGAFLAGLVMDHRWFNPQHLDALRQHLLLIVMPIFFLSTGLKTQWSVEGVIVFGAALLLLLASVSGKLIGVHIAGKLLKWRPGEASVFGWLLQTKALIMIVFANVLLDRHIISSETFTALLLMAVVSTMLTIPMVTKQLKRIGYRTQQKP